VYLGYCNGHRHLSINGDAELSDNRSIIKRIWTPSAQAFWPNGPDDPSIVAIVVTPHAAEYWDGPTGIVASVKMAFALATGKTPDFGENAKVAM
jgi:general stress protein 26